MKLLEKLYTTLSPSKQEEPMANLVKEELSRMKIPFKQDKFLQIYNLIPGTPLMVAHMDQVQSTKCHKVMSFKNSLYGFTEKGKLSGLGADDKNGIFIILQMLERFREDISFIFSANEEAGGYLGRLLAKQTLDNPYGLIFDRKGKGDIIGTSNDYCCDDLEIAVETIGAKQKYRATLGVFSDADELSNHIPCVNLSCGYYEAHTEREHTKPAELWNAIKLAEELLTHLPKKGKPFELPEKWAAVNSLPKSTYWGKGWSGYDYSKYSQGPKTTKAAKVKEYTLEEDALLVVEYEEVYLTHPDLDGEILLGESLSKAMGCWETDIGELEVKLNLGGEVEATLNGIPIEVEDYMRDGQYPLKLETHGDS